MKPLRGPFVLAPDAVAVAVTDLPAGFRRGLASDPGSVVWSRVQSRLPSMIVGGDANLLLQQFRNPCAIPRAVVDLSAAQGLSAPEVMIQSYAFLREAVNRRLLLPKREWAAARIEPVLRPGDHAGRWRVVESIQVLEDSEVHRVVDGEGRPGALKLGRTPGAIPLLAREARILARIEGGLVPALLDRGRHGSRAFLVLAWRDGQSPDVVVESLRTMGLAARPQLRAIALAILEAYDRLHTQGVVHGDVHARNLLLGPDGRVTVLDLGHAVAPGIAPAPGRVGVPELLEPEAAAALRRGERSRPATMAGEQYSVAALVYELVTGQPYLDFRHDPAAFLDQVTGEPPRPFAALGVPPWPGLESALGRALSKEPSARFISIGALARSLRRRGSPSTESGRGRSATRWLEREIDRLGAVRKPARAGRATSEQVSVYAGESGRALALLRIAQRRDDPGALAAADAHWAWAIFRAMGRSRRVARFKPGALLQGTASIMVAGAAIAHVRSDATERAEAIRWFARLARGRPASPELSDGTAGLLLGASRLMALEGLGSAEQRLLRGVQSRTAARLLRDGRRAGGPAARLPWANLGMAHGWAGILYALVAWQQSRPGRRAPPELTRWLDQLDARAENIGQGRRWPWLARRHGRLIHGGSMTGWCNGSAGFALLYATAAHVLGRPVDLARAKAAAWDAWAFPPPGADLCCGSAGAAYALLSLARLTGETRWVTRARSLGEYAARFTGASVGRAGTPSGLFRGNAGLALLLTDLEQPAGAAFPLLEGLA